MPGWGAHPGWPAGPGDRVKFLTFREVEARLNTHLLAGQPLRALDGGDNGVRVLDLDGDGFQDVVIGNAQLQRTRLWDAAAASPAPANPDPR